MSTTPAQSSRIRAGVQVVHAAATLASLTVLVALAACAQTPGGDGDQAGPGAPGSGVVSSGPLPPPGSTSPKEPTPNVITPEPAVDLQRQRWNEVVPVRGTREVLVHGSLTGGPPCAVLGRVEVSESSDQVTITVWVGRQEDATCDGPQPQVAYPFVTRVTLAAPLGERDVRDGAA